MNIPSIASLLPTNHPYTGAVTEPAASTGSTPYLDKPGSLPASSSRNLSERKCKQPDTAVNREALCNIIRSMAFTIDYSLPHSFHLIRTQRAIKGNALLEGKYNLTANCINTCTAMLEILRKTPAVTALGFKAGLCVINEAGNNSTIYFEPDDQSSIADLIANSYLIFEHADSGEKLILDPNINATLLKVNPEILTASELRGKVRSTLAQQHNSIQEEKVYSFPGCGFMPSKSCTAINRYIFNSSHAPTLEQATDLLFNAMYGENMNPKVSS